MEIPITASFRWSKEEMSRASAYANREAGGRWIRDAMFWGASLIIFFAGLYQFYTERMDRAKFVSLFPLCIVLFASPFLFRFLQPAIARLRFRNNPQIDRMINWEVTADRIAISSDLAKTEFVWGAVVKVFRVTEGFLVATQSRIFQWLPLHAFHNAADVQRFAELAQTKVKKYRDRT